MDIKQKILTLDQLVELAKIVEDRDPIAWDNVNMEPDTAYKMMAAHVIDLFEDNTEADREIVMMGTMTKLLVENLILNIKLLQNNS